MLAETMTSKSAPGYTYAGKPDEEAIRLAKQSVFFVEQDLPLLQRFGLKRGMSVLDVGCGAGTVTLEIAKFVFPGQVVGIDRDEALIEQAKKSITASNLNVEFIVKDILFADLPENSFDFVYCRFVLWAIPERMLALQNMVRLTKPEGIICAQEPDASGAIYWPEIPAHQNYWNGRIRYHQDKQDGIDPNLGRKLFMLFSKAGILEIKFGIGGLYKDNFDWQISTKEYVGPGADAIKSGYISEQVLIERAEWARNPLSFMMFPTIVMAGHKPKVAAQHAFPADRPSGGG